MVTAGDSGDDGGEGAGARMGMWVAVKMRLREITVELCVKDDPEGHAGDIRGGDSGGNGGDESRQ